MAIIKRGEVRKSTINLNEEVKSTELSVENSENLIETPQPRKGKVIGKGGRVFPKPAVEESESEKSELEDDWDLDE